MTNKLKYFIANWKMFGNLTALTNFNRDLRFFSLNNKDIKKKSKIILCVPNTLIYFSKKIKSKFISLGAQNCHHEKKYGPYTGSVSSYMLKNVGAEFVILGHSENRLNGETNKLIKKKIESALNQNLKVILCVGETLNENLKGKTLSAIKHQLNNSIPKKCNLKKVFIAYEPVWSIGSGKILKKKELLKIFKFIKNRIKKSYKIKKAPIVFYGGSVNSKNIRNFSSISDIDGFLVGGASKSAKNFIDIIKNYYK